MYPSSFNLYSIIGDRGTAVKNLKRPCRSEIFISFKGNVQKECAKAPMIWCWRLTISNQFIAPIKKMPWIFVQILLDFLACRFNCSTSQILWDKNASSFDDHRRQKLECGDRRLLVLRLIWMFLRAKDSMVLRLEYCQLQMYIEHMYACIYIYNSSILDSNIHVCVTPGHSFGGVQWGWTFWSPAAETIPSSFSHRIHGTIVYLPTDLP